jgi:hypothetical protein
MIRHRDCRRLQVQSSVVALIAVPLRSRHRRNAVMLAGQDHINTAAHRAYGGGRRDPAHRNCALCAAAGAINLLQGRSLWTTGMIAEAVGADDDREALGAESVAQARQIRNVVSALAGARVAGTTGSPGADGGVALTAAVAWMATFAEGTVFVVLATGNIGHHWLNAVVTPSGVTYVDYQTDKVRRGQWNFGTVSRSDRPFHGVSSSQYDDGDTVYAIAFQR